MKKTLTKIAPAMIALGMFGAIACAEILETSLLAFVIAEGICALLLLAGGRIANKTAEAKASAEKTMRDAQRRNS